MKWEEFIEKIRDIGITLPKIESWNYLPIEEGYKVYRDILCNLLEDIPAIKNDTFLSIYICDFKIKKFYYDYDDNCPVIVMIDPRSKEHRVFKYRDYCRSLTIRKINDILVVISEAKNLLVVDIFNDRKTTDKELDKIRFNVDLKT